MADDTRQRLVDAMSGPTYSLADFLQERRNPFLDATPPATLGGDDARRPNALISYGKGSVQPIAPPALGQHNFLGRFLGAGGQASIDALREMDAGRATPADVGWAFLGGMGSGPFGTVRSRIPNPIRAYHGSPHQFDEFRMDRIGTGEGAQAYGHGLYFAESEPVARSYRRTLAGPDTTLYDGVPLFESPRLTPRQANLAWDIANYARAHGGDFAAAREYWLRRVRNNAPDSPDLPLIHAVDSSRMRFHQPGHMYEVNIHARPEHFLDYDRLFGDMSQQAQSQLRRAGFTEPEGYMPSFLDHLQARHGPQGATDVLRDVGFPGIRYRDAGSRGAAETATRNYVIFDPSLIEILRRYGIAAPIAGTGVAAGFSDRQQK